MVRRNNCFSSNFVVILQCDHLSSLKSVSLSVYLLSWTLMSSEDALLLKKCSPLFLTLIVNSCMAKLTSFLLPCEQTLPNKVVNVIAVSSPLRSISASQVCTRLIKLAYQRTNSISLFLRL